MSASTAGSTRSTSTTTGVVFKRTAKELATDIKKGVRKGHYIGLYMSSVRGLPNLVFEELVASGKIGPLRYFFTDETGQSETYARYNGPEDQIGAMLDALLDRDAANLVGVGINTWLRGDGHAAWDKLLSRRHDLTSLEHLRVDESDAHHIAGRLAGLGIRDLQVTGHFTGEDLERFLRHGFARDLERFKSEWNGKHLDFVRLVEGGLAPNVRDWCVIEGYEYGCDGLFFDMAKATYWRDRLGGKEEHLLDARAR